MYSNSKSRYFLKNLKLVDFLIICTVISITIYSYISMPRGKSVGRAHVVVAGKDYAEFDIRGEISKDTIALKSGNVVLEYGNGSISIISSSCPNKICTNFGKISRTSQAIVCVPNRVMVTVKGKDDIFDGIAR